jgi:hypothetical protein
MNGRALAGGTATACTLAALLLAGCSSSPSTRSSGTTAPSTAAGAASTTSTSTSASSSGSAPCTRSAIATAAAGDTNLGQIDSVVNFGCDGGWAYANVTVGSGSGAYDAVIVLEAEGSTWSVADRAHACNNHLVPASIDTRACTTS